MKKISIKQLKQNAKKCKTKKTSIKCKSKKVSRKRTKKC